MICNENHLQSLQSHGNPRLPGAQLLEYVVFHVSGSDDCEKLLLGKVKAILSKLPSGRHYWEVARGTGKVVQTIWDLPLRSMA